MIISAPNTMCQHDERVRITARICAVTTRSAAQAYHVGRELLTLSSTCHIQLPIPRGASGYPFHAELQAVRSVAVGQHALLLKSPDHDAGRNARRLSERTNGGESEVPSGNERAVRVGGDQKITRPPIGRFLLIVLGSSMILKEDRALAMR